MTFGLLSICVFIYPCVYLSSYLTTYLSIYLSIHLSIRTSVCLSVSTPNTTIGLKCMTTISDNNDIQRGMFQPTSVSVLSNVLIVFWSSKVVLTPKGNFFIVPLLHSVSGIYIYIYIIYTYISHNIQELIVLNKATRFSKITRRTTMHYVN